MGLLSVMTGAALVAALILPWEPAFLCDILRASGRMAWPVFYWFACWSIALVAVRFTRPLACGVLGLCIALQAFDLAPKLNQKHRDDLGPGELTKLSCALPSQKMTDALWDLGNSKKHLWIITRDYVPKEADRLGLLAIQKGMKINCPYVARSYGKITKQRNKEMTDLLDAGNIPEDVVYYVYPNARMHATLAVERAAAQVEFIEEGGFTLLTRAKQPSEELAQSNRLRWSLATPSLAIAPGQPISFAAGGEASACPGALSGFSDFLADGVSTYLPDASIILKVPASPTDLRLMTTVQAALNPKTNPGQSVKIYANDAPVGKWSFTSSEPMQREIVIPRRLIPKNSLVFLRFEIAQAVSPKTLGINADPRELGVHFVRMESAPRD